MPYVSATHWPGDVPGETACGRVSDGERGKTTSMMAKVTCNNCKRVLARRKLEREMAEQGACPRCGALAKHRRLRGRNRHKTPEGWQP